MPRSSIAALVAAAALLASPAAAGPFAPGGNASALARGFALPSLGDGPVLAPGLAQTRLTFDVANEYVSEGDCSVECITLDGETRRLRLDYRAGLGRGWDFSLHTTALARGSGSLDGWIQDWHGWFGLPNGGRELVADDQFHYRYERAGVVLLEEIAGARGFGDVAFGLGLALGQGSALRTQLKLPTGDGAALSGGAVGGAAWLELATPAGGGGWDSYFAAGYSRQELGDVLPELQNREVWFGGLGVLAPLTRSVRLLLQVNAHTRLYDGSALTPLARSGAPLTIGLQFRTGHNGVLEIGFQEDPSVNGSPDFAFYVSLASLPRK
jgi:hypothetical protein